MSTRPCQWWLDGQCGRRLWAMARDIAYTFNSWHAYDESTAFFVRMGTWPAEELIREPRSGLSGVALHRAGFPRCDYAAAEAVAAEIRADRSNTLVSVDQCANALLGATMFYSAGIDEANQCLTDLASSGNLHSDPGCA